MKRRRPPYKKLYGDLQNKFVRLQQKQEGWDNLEKMNRTLEVQNQEIIKENQILKVKLVDAQLKLEEGEV